MLDQQWQDKGFRYHRLQGDTGDFYQLFFRGANQVWQLVAGSRSPDDMNGLAESVWNRMISLRTMGEAELGEEAGRHD